LKALAERPGEILSRDELYERTGAGGGGRAVDVQVTRLRRKIEPDPRLPRYLQTVRGRGYVLRPD
jgi:two-component system phosphate regulon response regulator OmpR